MKKLNNKGVTLVELIVSFALVGVAIIYFFQTLYTVKKVYADARFETNDYIRKDYTLRIAKANIEKGESICNKNEYCSPEDTEGTEYCSSNICHVEITYFDGKTKDSKSKVKLYYYKS